MTKYDQSSLVIPSLLFLAIKSFCSFRKEKNSDINVTKKSLFIRYEIYKSWLRDLTLNSSPCRDTRHQPKEKSVHNDSLLDRKRVRLLLRNRPLVLPSMILSFVYLLSISKTKIKTRDKFNSLQSTHIISLITKKINVPKEWSWLKNTPHFWRVSSAIFQSVNRMSQIQRLLLPYRRGGHGRFLIPR